MLGIPEFQDPKLFLIQEIRYPRMVTTWCHPGVTMVGPKGKRERFPRPNRGQRGKGKEVPPEMEPGSHWTVPPRVARMDETKRFPGWGTWRSHPPNLRHRLPLLGIGVKGPTWAPCAQGALQSPVQLGSLGAQGARRIVCTFLESGFTFLESDLLS